MSWTRTRTNAARLRLQGDNPEQIMWKNLAILALLGVLACLWSDLMRLFERLAPRDLVIVLVLLGTIATVSFIRHAARRL